MRFEGLIKEFSRSESYQDILKADRDNKLPCQVHGLAESQKAFVSYCLFESLQRQVFLVTHNDIEAKKLYDDIRTFAEDRCVYFPSKEIVFNIDASSGEIKNQRLMTIGRLMDGEKLIVVASVDSLFYRMPPPQRFSCYPLVMNSGEQRDILSISAQLIDMGYDRVDMVEGKGQFAQRGGILDIFSPHTDMPMRIEFYGDEIDTIRSFDVLTQRSSTSIKSAQVYPAREIMITQDEIPKVVDAIKDEMTVRCKSYSKKNKEYADKLRARVKENIEKLQNFRYFEGIDSYIPYIYDSKATLLDYFSNPLVIVDESARVSQRIRAAAEEFQDSFKNMLERGDVLPRQGEYMYSDDDIVSSITDTDYIAFNILPRIVEDFKPLSSVSFNAITMNALSGNAQYMMEEINRRVSQKYAILIMAGTPARARRLAEGLKEDNAVVKYHDNITELPYGTITVTSGSIARGMEFPDIHLSIISDRDMFGESKEKPRAKIRNGRKIQSFTDIKPGDYVVHVNHGIGVYKGIKELLIDGIKKDYLYLQYKGDDSLYVPVDQLDMVQKYIGNDDATPKLYKLGGNDWSKAKKKVKDSLRDMAEDLVALYAERSSVPGHAFSKDTPWQREFEEEFPYDETPDQLTSIQEIKQDMESTKSMDRLLCGDVGYGKTEVAMRAAFKAVMDGKQVVILVPTTILAEQHYNNFKKRFAEYAVNIDMLSRFRTPTQQSKTIKSLEDGSVDIIIGTHRLLNKKIKYKDLGLLIIDEEQRFGVSHKEKIKQLKKNIDVLTLTATPIPRTLHMSMTGVRDMSVIETPPQERYPVQTYVMEYNDAIIRDAIIREISRGGQVYFVYNRVETIKEMQLQLSRLVPEAKIVVGHGQMQEKQLEELILDFINGEGDVLLCTTIIETGIDIPNVNTLIVYDSDRMGLSQLYQLRGRVGRSTRLAYGYFTYRRDKILSETAEKRLKAIKEFTEFGSGFKIAMRDLEIRGAGNLLGTQQHGHMSAVGYDMYCRLLEEAVREIKGTPKKEYIETTIELPISAYIPESYIEDEMLKIELYKKIASISSKDDKVDIEEEATDRFGDIPKPVENLINIAYLKSIAKQLSITDIKRAGKDIVMTFSDPDVLRIDNIKLINEKMNDAVSFASSDKPALKLRLLDKNCKGDMIGTLKLFLETSDELHNKIK